MHYAPRVRAVYLTLAGNWPAFLGDLTLFVQKSQLLIEKGEHLGEFAMLYYCLISEITEIYISFYDGNLTSHFCSSEVIHVVLISTSFIGPRIP